MKKVYVMSNTIEADDFKSEDSGEALIYEPYDYSEPVVGDGCLFIRLQSWDSACVHTLLNSMVGKKIRITVEVED